MTGSAAVSIIILTTKGPSSHALIESLGREHHIRGIVFEDQKWLPARLFLRRLRTRGFIEVVDQILFKIADSIWLHRRAEKQSYPDPDPLPEGEGVSGFGELKKAKPIPNRSTGQLTQCVSINRLSGPEILETSSVNSEAVRRLIRRLAPDVVVVSGTTILQPDLLQSLGSIPVINIHCGITPRYRGAHGAFWAVVNNDWDNVGTTVHFIDSGVDTGDIIVQGQIQVEPDDTPEDLASKQHAIGRILASKAIADVASGRAEPVRRHDLDSRFYSSPTLSAYLRYRANMKEHFREK